MDLFSTINTMAEAQRKLTVDSGRVINFCYSQQAYTENNAAGVSTYAYANEQNIPIADSTVLETSATVLNKGFRAQAASIPRMLYNHLLGRSSFNVNKINDYFQSFLGYYKADLTSNDNLYSATATYNAGDICFVINNTNKRSFVCIAGAPISNEPPLDSEGELSAYWREVSTSSVNGKHGTVTVYGSDISISSTNAQTLEGFVNTKGQAGGLASLDENGRLPYTQLPESSIEYKGTWDASTNTPTIADGVGTNGDFYICSVGGTWNSIEFTANDRIICTGSGSSAVWSKLEGGNVNSVNNQLPVNGNVTLLASQITLEADPTKTVESQLGNFQHNPEYVTQAEYDALTESQKQHNYYIITDAVEEIRTDINDGTTALDSTWSSALITQKLALATNLIQNVRYGQVDTYAELLQVDTSSFGYGTYVYMVKADENYPNAVYGYEATLYVYLLNQANAVNASDRWRFIGKMNFSEQKLQKAFEAYTSSVLTPSLNSALANYDNKTVTAEKYYNKAETYTKSEINKKIFWGSFSFSSRFSASSEYNLDVQFDTPLDDDNYAVTLVRRFGGSYWTYVETTITSKTRNGFHVIAFNNSNPTAQIPKYDYIVVCG